TVAFPGVFDLDQVVPGYAALPGVLAAYPSDLFVVSALPQLRLSCALAQGDTYHYFVPTSLGNPLRLFHFTSHTREAPQLQGAAPQLQGVAESGDQPAWKALSDACFGAYVLIKPL